MRKPLDYTDELELFLSAYEIDRASAGGPIPILSGQHADLLVTRYRELQDALEIAQVDRDRWASIAGSILGDAAVERAAESFEHGLANAVGYGGAPGPGEDGAA